MEANNIDILKKIKRVDTDPAMYDRIMDRIGQRTRAIVPLYQVGTHRHGDFDGHYRNDTTLTNIIVLPRTPTTSRELPPTSRQFLAHHD